MPEARVPRPALAALLAALVLLGGLAVGAVLAGRDDSLEVTQVRLTSDAVEPGREVRAALLTDLHSCCEDGSQREILDAVARVDPDLVLLAGDIIDDVEPRERGLATIAEFAGRYPAFYSTGNHEMWTGEVGVVIDEVRALGIPVLEGEGVDVDVRGTPVTIAGIDDPDIGDAEYHRQLALLEASREERAGRLTILLAHRPDRAEDYVGVGADVLVAGHAHGGQWRLPGVLEQGLYAPDQGVVPRRTSGTFDTEAGQLVVSRGLSPESTVVPRLFNRPELVVLTVVGA